MSMTVQEITDAKSRLKALRKARDSGVLRVEHSGQSTTFRSLSEIDTIIARLANEIAQAEGTTRAPSYIRQTGKGL